MRQAARGIFLSTILGVLSVAAAEELSAQEAQNKAIATRVFEEIFNQGKFPISKSRLN
jgi:hypothetical protein